MRRVRSECGVWFRLRHVTKSQEIWVGSVYIKPDCNQVEHERRIEDHLAGLPATHLPVIPSGDMNSPFQWVNTPDRGLRATAKNGKTNQALTQLASRGWS